MTCAKRTDQEDISRCSQQWHKLGSTFWFFIFNRGPIMWTDFSPSLVTFKYLHLWRTWSCAWTKKNIRYVYRLDWNYVVNLEFAQIYNWIKQICLMVSRFSYPGGTRNTKKQIVYLQSKILFFTFLLSSWHHLYQNLNHCFGQFPNTQYWMVIFRKSIHSWRYILHLTPFCGLITWPCFIKSDKSKGACNRVNLFLLIFSLTIRRLLLLAALSAS